MAELTSLAVLLRWSAIALLASLIAAAFADPACDVALSREAPMDELRPRAGSWSLDLRSPIGVVVGDSGTVLDVTRLELGVGRRISHRLYLGTTDESWHSVRRYESFGELALGADAWLRPRLQFGMCLAACLSLEPLSAYGVDFFDASSSAREP